MLCKIYVESTESYKDGFFCKSVEKKNTVTKVEVDFGRPGSIDLNLAVVESNIYRGTFE